MVDKLDLLREILALDPADRDNWDYRMKPKASVLTKKLGQQVTGEDICQVAWGFQAGDKYPITTIYCDTKEVDFKESGGEGVTKWV